MTSPFDWKNRKSTLGAELQSIADKRNTQIKGMRRKGKTLEEAVTSFKTGNLPLGNAPTKPGLTKAKI